MAPDEHELLHALLAHDVPGAEALRAQVEHARVVSNCRYGCGSIGFVYARDAELPPSNAESPFPVEGRDFDENGAEAGALLLFLEDGRLYELEVMSFVGDPLSLPEASSVRWWMPRSLLPACGGSLWADGR